MKNVITVLLAENQPIFMRGLSVVVQEDPALRIVGQATDGFTAWRKIAELKPDVAVVNIGLPRMTGLEVAGKLRKAKITTALLILTKRKQEDSFAQAVALGVRGYLLKEDAPGDLLLAIKRLAAGEPHFSPLVSAFLLTRNALQQSLRKRVPGLESLTPCQRCILKHIAEDCTTKEIADELGVSYRTVENHRSNICERLGLRGSHSLLKFAFDNKALL